MYYRYGWRERRIAIVDATIGINKIDGLVLSDEYIEKMYGMAYGRIKRSEFLNMFYNQLMI